MAETPGFGTKFQFGTSDAADPTAATTGWTDIGGITEVEPPAKEAADIKTSHMQTPDGVHTYRPGNVEPGEASVVLHWDPAVEAVVEPIFRIPKKFRVLFSDGTGRWFMGYIKKLGEKVDMEDLVTQEITVKVSGPVTKFVIAA